MNKKSKFLIAIIIAINGFFSNTYAQQSIYVEETNGAISGIPLSQIQKINFSENNMILHKTDGSTITWAIINIQKYYHGLTTGIDNIRLSENNDMLIYPNPSNGNFNINYQIKDKGKVSIYIVSIDGKIKRNLLSENKEQGKYLLNLKI